MFTISQRTVPTNFKLRASCDNWNVPSAGCANRNTGLKNTIGGGGSLYMKPQQPVLSQTEGRSFSWWWKFNWTT